MAQPITRFDSSSNSMLFIHHEGVNRFGFVGKRGDGDGVFTTKDTKSTKGGFVLVGMEGMCQGWCFTTKGTKEEFFVRGLRGHAVVVSSGIAFHGWPSCLA